ncbi:MAG: type II secretion system protein [Sideroxyarcus sp.]
MQQKHSLDTETGFTLIELLVTVVIVAILASVAMPLSALSRQRANEAELRQSLREIRMAIDTYKQAVDEGRIARSLDQSGYPPKLSVLVEGATDVKSPVSKKIYFLRRIPRDPFADNDVSAEALWGTRSYDSPSETPHAGRDVYDVYSQSDRTGLNGVPYREW